MKVEILAEGKWNGINITRAIMDQMVANFRHFKNVLKVPLKFGHNEKQPMTDGQPALGWIEDLWINQNGKMMASMADLPDIVKNAFEKKLYRTVSIEASLDVSHKGKEYGAVLTGLALLGADLPAVNTLDDLQTYMSAQDINDFSFSECANFAAISGNLSTTKGDTKMSKTVEELELELAKATATNATLSAQNTTLSVEKDAALTKAQQLEADAEAVKFTADKTSLEETMEMLVKADKITPGQRAKFTAQITDAASLAQVKATVDILGEGVTKETFSKKETGLHGKDDDDDATGKAPDEVLHMKAIKFKAKNNCDYEEALDVVMQENPDLARQYADMTGT